MTNALACITLPAGTNKHTSLFQHAAASATISGKKFLNTPVPNHYGPMAPQNGGRGGHNVMGNGRGGRLVVAGSVVSQWDNNRGGSAQQRLAKARNNKGPML
jgi:hypothetical protein